MQTISRDDIKKLLDEQANIALVEVLPKKEFAAGHLPGAISIPLETIRSAAPGLLRDRSQQIITYCTSTDCPNSTKAAEELESMGYKNVYEYVEGKDDWKKAGLPLAREIKFGVAGDDDSFAPKPDPLEEGHGEADAVSSRTTDDIEEMARTGGNPDGETPQQESPVNNPLQDEAGNGRK